MSSALQLQPSVVDLLDRVLERGLIIEADVIICLSGVPLVGLNLRAALAGMETMVQYGMMKDWDQAIRSRETLSTAVVMGTKTLPALDAPQHENRVASRGRP